MKINEIAPKFEELEERLLDVEKQAHTHEGEPPPEETSDMTEASEEVAEDVTDLFTKDSAEASTGNALADSEEPASDPEPSESPAAEVSEDDDATFPEAEKKQAEPTGNLEMDIQADVKAYAANTVAQALLHEVIAPKDNREQCRENVMVIENGETISVQPFRLTDATYKVVSREMLQRILEETKVDAIQWQAEAYDCEDIARKFVTRCCDLGINSVGRVMAWSGGHAFCIAIVQDGASVDFVFIEPQTDTIIEKFEGMYDISDALIIIA